MANSRTVAAGMVVSIHYKLTLDDGHVVDSSEGDEPLCYLHGAGNIVAGLEAAMEGRAVGDAFSVTVAPEQGYGLPDPDAVQTIERSAFPTDLTVERGATIQGVDEDENPMTGTITKVSGDEVTVDFNHPLAGMNLNFEIRVEQVRPSTAEERAHGHVHGPGGAEH